MKLFALVGAVSAQYYDYYGGQEAKNVQIGQTNSAYGLGNTRTCWRCDEENYADCTANGGTEHCTGEGYFCYTEERRKWEGNDDRDGNPTHNANQDAEDDLGDNSAHTMRIMSGCQQPQACMVQATQNYAIEIGLSFNAALNFDADNMKYDDSGYFNEGRCHHGTGVFDSQESVCHYCCDPLKDGQNCNELTSSNPNAAVAPGAGAYKPFSADSINDQFSLQHHGLWRNNNQEVKTAQNTRK